VTDAIDPNDDRPVLMRAIDIAMPIVEADVSDPSIPAALLAPETSSERVLAHAFMSLMDRYHAVMDPPRFYRCGWCVSAAGGTTEAWRDAERFDDPGIKAHTIACEYNPLVTRIRDLEIALSDLVAECEERTENPGGDYYAEQRELLARGTVLP